MSEILTLKFDPNTIEHLGISLYSKLPSVLSELVSNSWDADADNVIIKFYDKSGNMHIFYESYYTSLWGSGWSLGFIGEITDNFGKKYMSKSGQSNTDGTTCKGVWTVNDFSKEADELIISYDYYNRKYRVEIPLKKGDNYE